MWIQHLGKQKMRSRYKRWRILDYPLIGLTDYTPKWALWEGNETWPTALVCPYRSTLFFLKTLPQIDSFLTVCKDWQRLQWPSLQRLRTTATARVVTIVTAVLKNLKTQAFTQAKKFWCSWVHRVQLWVWNVATLPLPSH